MDSNRSRNSLKLYVKLGVYVWVCVVGGIEEIPVNYEN